MSTRDDARLTARERAAFASLEAAAAADDPQLAVRLRGSSRFRLKASLPRIGPRLAGAWAAVAAHGWWGAPVVVLGLVLVVWGMSAGLAVGLIGAGLATVGLRLVAGAIESWVVNRTAGPDGS